LVADPDSLISKADISELFESYKFVELETNEEALFGMVFLGKTNHDKIYLMPIGGKTGLKVFSLETGKYITSISKEGRGPGEYQFMFDLAFDRNGSLYLLSGRKVIEFDSTGKFRDEYKLPFQADNISCLWNDKFVLGTMYGGPEITIVNNKFKTLETHFPYEIYRNSYSNLLQEVNGNCYYFKPNFGTFYKIDDEKATPFLEITVEGFTPNKEITLKAIKKLGTSELTLANDYHKDLRQNGYSPFNFLINSKQFYGTFFHQETRYLLQYSINTNRYRIYDLDYLNNDITGDNGNFTHITLTENDELICLIQPYGLLSKEKAEINTYLAKVFRKVNEESNPILFIGKLKSF